jgi:hypothetical protein
MPRCPAAHDGPCNNCRAWAMTWRDDTLTAARAALTAPRQESIALDWTGAAA